MNAERRRWKRPSLSSLLIVILVVLWVLSEFLHAVMVPARERARRRKCLSRLNCAIGFACFLYASDYAEAYPPTMGHLYPDYMNNGEAWVCPSAGKATALRRSPGVAQADRYSWYTPAKFGDTHTDYVYVSGLRSSDRADYVLAFDDEWNHDGDGVNVVFVGANVEWLDIKDLHEWLAWQEWDLAAKGRELKLLRPAWSTWPDPPAGERPWHPVLWALRAAAALVLVALVSVAIFRARGRRDSGHSR